MAKILAVDIGGSGVRKAIVSGTSITGLVEDKSIRTRTELMAFINQQIPEDVSGVAYSMAGVINDHRKVVMSPNLRSFDETALADLTRCVTGLDSVVGNDMETAGLGMAGMFPQVNRFAGITISSGVGLRIVDSGNIFGDSEGGHMQVDNSPFAPLCGCGKRGCAEAIFGGLALQKRIIAETGIRGIKIPAECKDPCVFLDREFDNGEDWAAEIYSLITFGIARFLANLQTVLHLPAIIWKGSLGKNILRRKSDEITRLMMTMLINPDWAESLAFYYVWDVSPCKDAEAFIGAAELFRRECSR